MLRARCRLLSGVVDRHVMIEGSLTLQGQPRNPSTVELPPKVERHVVELPEGRDGVISMLSDLNWQRERTQRNAVADLVANEDPDAVVLVCDADELVDPEAIPRIARATMRGPVHLIMDTYYYGFGWMAPDPIWQPVAARVKDLKRRDIFAMRIGGLNGKVKNAGWHCSYWGGSHRVKEKLATFAHEENSAPERRQMILDGWKTGTGPNGEELVPAPEVPARLVEAFK